MRCLRPCTPPVRLFSVYSLRVQPFDSTSIDRRQDELSGRHRSFNRVRGILFFSAAPHQGKSTRHQPPGSDPDIRTQRLGHWLCPHGNQSGHLSAQRRAGSRGACNACGASACVRERRATASAANARKRAVTASSRFAASASAILDARKFPKRLSKLGDL
eukprot:scaffold8942_cov99-Isochrysis_galbana.AAC.8